MGNYRHPPADRENERRRSASLARADAPAHCRRLAHLPDRKTHAVELQDLNGLSFALTTKRLAGYEQLLIAGHNRIAELDIQIASLNAVRDVCLAQFRDQGAS